jgi:hypothetical protein
MFLQLINKLSAGGPDGTLTFHVGNLGVVYIKLLGNKMIWEAKAVLTLSTHEMQLVLGAHVYRKERQWDKQGCQYH